MLTLLATIVVLGVLILVHELGHFLAAKAVGIAVVRFSIGLGPKVWGRKVGETEYILSAIPLGGYVKMGGMDDEVLEMVEGGGDGEGEWEPGERDFDAKPLWARTLVISAGVLMNMLFAFAVYTAEVGLWGVQEFATVRVAGVEASALPPGAEELARLAPGSRIARIGARTVRHWGDVRKGIADAPPGALVLVTEGGERVSIRAPADPEQRSAVVRALRPWHEPVIREVNTGSPADRAGLRRGDVVVGLEGRPVETWAEFVDAVQERPGERLTLTVRRDGREISRTVVPDAVDGRDPATGEPAVIGQIGVLSFPDMVRLPVGPVRAVALGWQETVGTTGLILRFLWDLITGDISPRSVGSIVAIGEISGQVARQGADAFLRFLGFFSINLAILNLLPIPILDGGHLLFIAIEAVRGRALSVEQRIRLSQLGFIIVVGLMLWALANDVLRLFGL